MTHASSKINKCLLIGWDAADWMSIEPLLQQGKMPHLASLMEKGISAPLKTLEPKLSPLLWTSIATGKTADKHGILNFVEPKPEGDGLRISQSTSRNTKAIWNILSQNQLETLVIGWYASHPAEKIKGSVITNLLHEGFDQDDRNAPLLSGTVHPESLSASIAPLRTHYKNFPDHILAFLLPRYKEAGWGDERIIDLKKKMAYAESVAASTIYLLKNRPWDAGFVFFDAIDTMGHEFMQFRAPQMKHVGKNEFRWFSEVMDKVYVWHDQQLGKLLEAAGPDTNIILISDHGFHNGSLRPNLERLPPERRMELEASWHRTYGILVASGPDILQGSTPAPASLLDICPTILQLIGLPAGKDMSGRILKEIIKEPAEKERIESWDQVEGEDGMHPVGMRSNPIDTGASIRQLMDLGYLAAIPASAQDQIDLVLRESNFNLALLLMHLQREGEAIPLFEKLYQEKPSTARYLTCLVQCNLAAGNVQGMIPLLESHLSAYADHTELRMLLCNCYLLNHQSEAAKKLLPLIRKELSRSPENTLGYAKLLYDTGAYQDAAVSIMPYLKSYKNDPSFLILAAKIALAMGQMESAAERVLDALDISQALPEAHYLLGLILLWMGDVPYAEKSLKNAVHLQVGHKPAHLLLSAVYSLQGLTAQAQHHQQCAGAVKSNAVQQAGHDHPCHLHDFLKQRGLPHLL